MALWDFARYGDATALVEDSGASLTYDGLSRAGEELAAAAGGRCLVFSLCTNTIGSVVGYTGFLNAGIVPLLLNAQLEDSLLHSLLDVYTPTYLWAPEAEAGRFPGFTPVYDAFGYQLLRTGYPAETAMGRELALLLTTSGSTGSPKLVRQAVRNIRANTESIVEYLKLDASERAITTLPMNYTYGLSILNTHLWVGATMLLTGASVMQKEFWNFFREQGATSFGGVPYTYEMLDRLRFYSMKLPSLRTMTQAGGKLAPRLHEKFAAYAAERGVCFVVMYGQCEATARMAYLPPERALEKVGCMGIAIPGGRFRLLDAEGREIHTPHTTGELVYDGPNVTLGYAECREDLKRGDDRCGVLQTGDMAEFDEDGYYRIVGRKKRFLKIFGNRVNLDELEGLVRGQFPEADCACGGIDDHLYLFLTDSGTGKDAVEFLARITCLNPAAFRTVILPEIPKNDAGKVLYKELAKHIEPGA